MGFQFSYETADSTKDLAYGSWPLSERTADRWAGHMEASIAYRIVLGLVLSDHYDVDSPLFLFI